MSTVRSLVRAPLDAAVHAGWTDPTRRGELTLVGVLGLLTVVLVPMAGSGSRIGLIAALSVAALVAVSVVLGAERTGYLAMIAAFFTAPFYKGLSPRPDAPVTVTDLLLLLAFVLLVPRMLGGRVAFPPLYALGAGIVLASGLVASILSSDPTKSLIALVFWITVMVVLVAGFALWGPSQREVDYLAMTFVAGQIFSFVVGLAKHNSGQGRTAGLATQPNYLGQAAMFAIALLIYLYPRYGVRSVRWAATFVVAGGLVFASLVMSGSRAATVVTAVLLLMIPVVERSAIAGFVAALGVGAVVVALPFLIGGGPNSGGSAINRLAGGNGVANSDLARTQGEQAGVTRFLERPLTGNGFIDLFDIHNNYIEILVAVGVIGLFGYALVLFELLRPLLAAGPYRRLAYPAWGYLGFSATVPALYDRSIWAVLALAAAVTWAARREAAEAADAAGAAKVVKVAASVPGVRGSAAGEPRGASTGA